MKLLYVGAVLAACSVVAPAMAQQPCLQIGQVYDFNPVPGNQTLIVTDRQKNKFKLSFMAQCADLQFNTSLGFKSRGVGQLSCLATGDQVISPRGAGPADRCIIRKIENYTPAMEKADTAATAKSDRAK